MEITNSKNTICNFKRLLGRRYNDLFVQQEKELNAYSIIEGKNNSVNIEVRLFLVANTGSSISPFQGQLS